VRGDPVDVVPPGAADDHLLVHRERGGRLERRRPPMAGQIDRRVPLLTKRGARQIASTWRCQAAADGNSTSANTRLQSARKAGAGTP
jgi:hypothetical protein